MWPTCAWESVLEGYLIFTCLTPDILHQLHKGIFYNHLVQWCVSIVSEKEVDACFQAMTQYPALCHFKKGISLVSQWTGTEHKEMQRVFGLLASAVEDCILMVACLLLDFIYYAQLQQHMDTTLAVMEESLKTFHDYKHVLVELEVHKDFNMPKIHSMQHYISLIHALGKCLLGLEESHVVPLEDGFMDADTKVHYKVAKTPPHHQVSVDSIECGYGAFKFIPKIYALPNIAAHGHKNKTPARFDTMFILEEDHTHTDNMWLAQVCIIFKLPEYLRTYPHLLVYIEWFTALQHQDPMSSLYIAWCGKEISRDWTLANVLEKATSFYVNSYIDLDMFLALQ
ncbi:hypothetical protein EDC04DRAFT_2868480 [Pisolithus marmoratus]|nr:hypothetical protein EDC04DRAFT_2868480 [Pisolithus marmoratus]